MIDTICTDPQHRFPPERTLVNSKAGEEKDSALLETRMGYDYLGMNVFCHVQVKT